LNWKPKKKFLIKSSILVLVLLIVVLVLTGCVQGMTPIGWAGIAVDNNVAYTVSKEGRLVAVNLANNSIRFAEPLKAASSGGAGCAFSSGSSGSACGGSAPAIAVYGTPVLVPNVPLGVDSSGKVTIGTIAVIAGYNGKVIAYDTNSLQQLWQYPQDTNLKPIISAVSVSGNTLYFGCTDNNIYALDVARGNKKWQASTGGEIWSSPVVDNNLVIVSSFDNKIYALDANSGDKKWEYPTGSTNVATPLTLDGVVYVGSLDRNLYAINESDGTLKWKFSEAQNWFWAKPVAVNGVIYAPCLDSRVYVIDAKTGSQIAAPDVQGQVSSWPVVVNNQVVVATKNGKLISLDTTNTAAVPRQISIIPENVTAPLLAVNNSVYINGPDNNILGYDIVTGAKLSPVSLKSQ
jgi:eukaryotic-like serine/threonine-protein kinase